MSEEAFPEHDDDFLRRLSACPMPPEDAAERWERDLAGAPAPEVREWGIKTDSERYVGRLGMQRSRRCTKLA